MIQQVSWEEGRGGEMGFEGGMQGEKGSLFMSNYMVLITIKKIDYKAIVGYLTALCSITLPAFKRGENTIILTLRKVNGMAERIAFLWELLDCAGQYFPPPFSSKVHLCLA